MKESVTEHAPLVASIVFALVSAAVSIGTVFYLRRKDKREDHSQANEDVALALKYKDDLIESLQEDREELKLQLRLANERGQRYEEEVRGLRDQLRSFESESRQVMARLLESFAQSERCLVNNCPQRVVPGDRRDPNTVSTVSMSPGGTD